MKKVRLATVWLDGCSGCHMSLLDIDEAILAIAKRVDVVYGPLVDAQEFPKAVDVTLVEGAVSSQDDLEKVHTIRRWSKLVVALGDCAVTGNVPAMRNTHPARKLLERIYVEGAQANRGVPVDGVPALLRQAVPVQEVIKVDLHIPGCPPSPASIAYALGELRGRPHAGTGNKSEIRVRRASMKKLVIDPVTRIEGHAKIDIFLDDAGHVTDTQFHVTQVRGFEKFTEGRPFYEMPAITARICGICPVSHLLASAKACDAIMAVAPPPAGGKAARADPLRAVRAEPCPELLPPLRARPAVGLRQRPGAPQYFRPDRRESGRCARAGVALRKFGQEIIQGLAQERVHPSWIVPGGVNAPLQPRYAIVFSPDCRQPAHSPSVRSPTSRPCSISLRRKSLISVPHRRCTPAWWTATAVCNGMRAC